MSTTPDPAAADESPESADEPASRRIPIGTQRPGVDPPAMAARYQYIAPPQRPGVDPPSPDAAVAAAPPPSGAAAPPPAGKASKGRGDRPRDRGSRATADVGAPARLVAVPNIRAALDDDLAADFAAALEGVPVDELLVSSVPPKPHAPLEPGSRVLATVLSVAPDTAFVDLGGQRQGALKLAGLVEAGIEIPAVGQIIEVSVGGRNDEDNLYDVAPANRAVAIEDWSQLEAGMIVAARVTAANKGGLECEVAGLRGFMPASLVSTWRVENLEEMVGQTLDSLVTELVPAARRLVLSRRAVIEKQAADARQRLLETLEPGVELDGTVRSVRDFGAFVDIGDGVDGLVHVSELSWDRVSNPTDLLQPGQKVRVVVKRIDHQTGKIGLSVRDLVESPWKRAAETYHVGRTVTGTVSRLAQFGAFVKLEPGVEGLVHISELATRRIRSVADVVREGQEVECRVLAVDPDEQRLSLSIKALAPKPDAAKPAAGPGAEAVDDAPPPAARKRSSPLKGGIGGESHGARFGLRW